ncbi:hypothetical protein [Halogranum rubrum]|uniref:Uncharacterized protein n=1 Tax=Halogranum salarium B-1 TaxID=1210908 RepID=J2ZZ24_9EURY|nr:hypothetical protein [Halogranum salarium]EJN58278.1 hypothetical protein HSB1_36950 [Halogranum salarium B-1]
MHGTEDTPTTEASEMTHDGATSTSAGPSSSTQHTSADVAPELFEP